MLAEPLRGNRHAERHRQPIREADADGLRDVHPDEVRVREGGDYHEADHADASYCDHPLVSEALAETACDEGRAVLHLILWHTISGLCLWPVARTIHSRNRTHPLQTEELSEMCFDT